ncbi:MAG TPA: hypothetical protein VGD48_31015 [Kutzneria sp.]
MRVFVVEGRPDPADIDAGAVVLHAFRVTDPTGKEQAGREATYARIRQMMMTPRTYRTGPDGTMRQITSGTC